MKAGPLDSRITIQRATLAENSVGEFVPTWAAITTLPASKVDIPDGERWRAAEVAATVTTRFQIRWNAVTATVSPKDRIVCDGRTYDIHHVKELGRRVGLEVTASARAE
jgi:SPP1 family predicted phage head-tail adaptor